MLDNVSVFYFIEETRIRDKNNMVQIKLKSMRGRGTEEKDSSSSISARQTCTDDARSSRYSVGYMLVVIIKKPTLLK